MLDAANDTLQLSGNSKLCFSIAYIKTGGEIMKKLLLLIVTLFALTTVVHAGVNINTATQAELETLQGIGPGKAKAIIDYRTKNGAFKSVDDLEKVEGIGPGIIKQLRQDAMVSGASTVSKQDKPAAKPEDKSGKKEDKPTVKQEKKPVAK